MDQQLSFKELLHNLMLAPSQVTRDALTNYVQSLEDRITLIETRLGIGAGNE